MCVTFSYQQCYCKYFFEKGKRNFFFSIASSHFRACSHNIVNGQSLQTAPENVNVIMKVHRTLLCLKSLCLFLQINNMKTKFKETIEKCDNLEQRLNELLKEKQSVERKYVFLSEDIFHKSNYILF